MSSSIANTKAAMQKDMGKLQKLLAALKKLLAKEFLWVLFILIAAIPTTFVLEYLLNENWAKPVHDKILEVLTLDTIREALYVISIAGLYFSRTVAGAIKTLTKKQASA